MVLVCLLWLAACVLLVCSDLVVVHEALGFGHCHLALGVPMGGKFASVHSLEQLKSMDCWTEETPLRVVTGGWVQQQPCSGTMLLFNRLCFVVKHEGLGMRGA